MLELRAAHPEVTGVICNGDQIALGACLALARNGEEPGKEVSIVGFDDIQDAAVATPPLTTMAPSPNQLGRRLARALLERIRNPDSPIAISEISVPCACNCVKARAVNGPLALKNDHAL